MSRWWYRDSWPWPLWQGGIHHLPGAQPRILLTFDDGPSETSLALADIMEARGLHAVFFLLAGPAAAYPDHVRRLVGAGHTIASHGLHHERQGLRSPARVTQDLRRAKDILEQASGLPVPWVRPPYGSWAPWLNGAARAAGQRCMFWSLNPKDHAAPDGPTIIDHTLAYARAGDILLLHCTGRGAGQTLKALPGILDGLERRGFEVAGAEALGEL